jgi:hypothetical protein
VMLRVLKGGSSPGVLEAGNRYFDSVIQEIEGVQIYPRLNSYRDVVLLALLDKVITTGRAVLRLVHEGFADQAFGLSRTVMEAFFALKYIENKDSEARAKRYLEYFGKDREHLMNLVGKHHSHLSGTVPPEYPKLLDMAKQFKSPHKWYPEPSLKEVAYEESTWATDALGQPEKWEHAYDIVYKLCSHEVHATSVALGERIAGFRENSRQPSAFMFSGPTFESDGDSAILNACIYSQAAIEHVFHAFDIAVPPSLRAEFGEWQKAIGIGSPSVPVGSAPAPTP